MKAKVKKPVPDLVCGPFNIFRVRKHEKLGVFLEIVCGEQVLRVSANNNGSCLMASGHTKKQLKTWARQEAAS